MSESDSNMINVASVVTCIVITAFLLCIIGLTYATIKKNGNGFVLMSIAVLILFITCMVEQAATGHTGLGYGILDIMGNN